MHNVYTDLLVCFPGCWYGVRCECCSGQQKIKTVKYLHTVVYCYRLTVCHYRQSSQFSTYGCITTTTTSTTKHPFNGLLSKTTWVSQFQRSTHSCINTGYIFSVHALCEFVFWLIRLNFFQLCPWHCFQSLHLCGRKVAYNRQKIQKAQLSSCRASLPVDCYQVILVDDEDKKLRTACTEF